MQNNFYSQGFTQGNQINSERQLGKALSLIILITQTAEDYTHNSLPISQAQFDDKNLMTSDSAALL